ncbi:MAG: glycolate oxidase subunit GlcE [Gammaproteobacteria bacterium]|nr:glycolate oxidase subunit GlcE [Gammaproteobacteria bacterium]
MSRDISDSLQEQVLAAANAGTPLTIHGGSSKAFLGNTSSCDTATLLDVSPHSGIISYEPVELVVTARAGTPLKELEQALAAQGQMLPFEPPHYGDNATLGGTIACGLSGPRRPFAGSARDYVLGVKLINGRGEILQFGGQVMKNVAGYDCSRLMAGAMGTLGVLLEISLKVLPIPAAEQTLVKTLDASRALKTMNELAGQSSPLSAISYDGQQLYLRLCGTETAVASAAKCLGGEKLDKDTDFWNRIKEHRHAFFQHPLPLWRLSVPATAPLLDLPGQWFIDWAGAQRWLITDSKAERIRQLVSEQGGHATAFRNATNETDRFQTPEAGVMLLHTRLKQAFDPKGIFNPGRLYADLQQE